MAMIPMEYKEKPTTLQNFTPTAASGFTINTAKYKYINDNTIFFILQITQTTPAALTGTTICTFPSSIKPTSMTMPITVATLDSSYVLSGQANGNLSWADGTFRVKSSAACKYLYATGVYAIES